MAAAGNGHAPASHRTNVQFEPNGLWAKLGLNPMPMNATEHPLPAEIQPQRTKNRMNTSTKIQIQPRRAWRTLAMLTATALALWRLAPAAWANGAAYYLDPNGGATAGFDVGSGTYAQSSVQWISSPTGSGTE